MIARARTVIRLMLMRVNVIDLANGNRVNKTEILTKDHLRRSRFKWCKSPDKFPSKNLSCSSATSSFLFKVPSMGTFHIPRRVSHTQLWMPGCPLKIYTSETLEPI